MPDFWSIGLFGTSPRHLAVASPADVFALMDRPVASSVHPVPFLLSQFVPANSLM